ncbi:MAG: gluconate 2-dehydrogenase subunit 3 family protein [Deltaproteobacteria bacterium]|nr:gluconate 2-dehydrogenase subunit 3 family protein [Deltaproteobacteria bacterium]
MSEDTNDSGFSPHEARALASVLDEIIPPSGDGRLPGAGEVGLVRYIEQHAPEIRPTIVQGLSALDELAHGRGARDFAALCREDKLELLNELSTAQPAFLPGLILQSYVGYYQNDRVLEGLGLEPRPPYPEGYKLEPTDLGLLDGVRRRDKLYRD